MKLTVSKSKNSASFYVQKSIRKPDGTVTSVTIEKLGNLEEVKTKANGQDPYIWAQNYVNELNRREYEEAKEVIARFRPSKLIHKNEQKAFNCGYLFLQYIYFNLGIDKIMKSISKRYSFEYDLNEIFSTLLYTRILYPSSKLASKQQAMKFLQQPTFELHDIYRALSVLSKENEFIQSELYKNSRKVIGRRSDILYYDCTNYFFEIEEEDQLRRYGRSKQHQPLPLVGMGLFMDQDGIPLAFDIYPGNQNEQPTLKPLEQRVIKDYGVEQLVICTDAGLSSAANRRFNDKTRFGERLRSFVTTQSIKTLPENLKSFSLSTDGWHLIGDNRTYNLNELDPLTDYDKVFYKDQWVKENLSKEKILKGESPLEQHLIVSFSLKYQAYQRKIRNDQIERAKQILQKGQKVKTSKTQNDPNRFIMRCSMTENGEIADQDAFLLDENKILEEERFDGFYAVCTNLETSIADIIRINKKRWEIEECFRIMKFEFKARPVFLQRQDRIKAHFLTCFSALLLFRILEKKLGEHFTCDQILSTLRSMNLLRMDDKQGYLPAYTRTDLTDALHETFGFRTDYEIIPEMNMKRIVRNTKQMNYSKK